MNTFKLSNISLADFRKFLKCQDLEYKKCEGDHERWTRKGLTRPVTFSNKHDPVPELFVQNTFKNLGFTRKKFIEEFQRCIE